MMAAFARRTNYIFVALALFARMAGASGPQTGTNTPEKPLPTGQVIDNIQCVADPTQAYALYLPTHYSPAKAWPILYTFDPEAHGKIPVESYKDAAEEYGYIIAASNNSRNFQSDVSKAAQAMWEDTHVRLAIDSRRVYTMGFSGGARVATMLAMLCEKCAIAGVIAHGASYPYSLPPSDKDRFAYFAVVGDKDFNWPELVQLKQKKEQWPAPFRLRVYEGRHQWAPPEILKDALEWLQLKAMQTGAAPPHVAFIDRYFERTQKDAEDALQRKDSIAQFEAYRLLALDFSGLKDVSQFQAKLATLKNSPELKQALKKEQEAVDKQRALTEELSAKMAQAGEADLGTQQALIASLTDGLIALRREAEHAKKPEARLIYTRSFNDLWVQAIEAGQSEMEVNKQYTKADFYFQLVSNVTPDQAWPVLLLAETSALRGDKKRAFKELHEAVKRGMKHPESITEDANLQSLRSDPEFQQIVAELKAKLMAQPAAP